MGDGLPVDGVGVAQQRVLLDTNGSAHDVAKSRQTDVLRKRKLYETSLSWHSQTDPRDPRTSSQKSIARSNFFEPR